MTLREARCLFSRLIAELVQDAYAHGYEVAIGEVTRDQRVAALNAAAGKGIANSLHLVGLAADLHLYREGRYLPLTEDHAELGALWKGKHELCRWGGDFQRKDGNHYSISWEGRA